MVLDFSQFLNDKLRVQRPAIFESKLTKAKVAFTLVNEFLTSSKTREIGYSNVNPKVTLLSLILALNFMLPETKSLI